MIYLEAVGIDLEAVGVLRVLDINDFSWDKYVIVGWSD